MRERDVNVNGVRLRVLEDGDGPLVVLLHGFPDNAFTWDRQIPALVAAGYRVIAPFLRGYPPSEVPVRGYFDRATLALDIEALIQTQNGGAPALLVAQDWGAAIAYGVLGAFPGIVRRAVLLAVPHPQVVRATLRRSPAHVIRSFHWFLFQLPRLPEALCSARDHAFIETLWRLWSPAFDDAAHVAQVRRMLAQPGAMHATLNYYRALFQRRYQDPALGALRARLDDPIRVPTLVACGGRDMRRHLLAQQRTRFAGAYEWRVVEGAGHFLHREKPAEVNALILDWLARPSAS
jgi:pimeloyl-ACP methyl ester carboxylesterase